MSEFRVDEVGLSLEGVWTLETDELGWRLAEFGGEAEVYVRVWHAGPGVDAVDAASEATADALARTGMSVGPWTEETSGGRRSRWTVAGRGDRVAFYGFVDAGGVALALGYHERSGLSAGDVVERGRAWLAAADAEGAVAMLARARESAAGPVDESAVVPVLVPEEGAGASPDDVEVGHGLRVVPAEVRGGVLRLLTGAGTVAERREALLYAVTNLAARLGEVPAVRQEVATEAGTLRWMRVGPHPLASSVLVVPDLGVRARDVVGSASVLAAVPWGDVLVVFPDDPLHRAGMAGVLRSLRGRRRLTDGWFAFDRGRPVPVGGGG